MWVKCSMLFDFPILKNLWSPPIHTKNDQIRNNLLLVMPNNLVVICQGYSRSQTLKSNKKDSDQASWPHLFLTHLCPMYIGSSALGKQEHACFSRQIPAQPFFPLWEKSRVKATFLKSHSPQIINKRLFISISSSTLANSLLFFPREWICCKIITC